MNTVRPSGARDPRLIAALSLSVDLVTAELSSRLFEAGVPFSLLKGPTVAQWLYTDGERRPYYDTDLLVAPAFETAAEVVLRAAGFVSDLGTGGVEPHAVARHHVWVRDGKHVELHTTLIGIGATSETAWRVLGASTEEIEVIGCRVPVLSVPARALHVALHAAQHGPEWGTPVRDLERALAALPASVWEQALRLSSELVAGQAFSAGLRLRPEGSALAERLGLAEPTDPVVRLRALGATDVAQGLARLWLAPGWRPKSRLLLRAALPSPQFMRWWSPLAARSRAGLIAMYVVRPLYLASRFPSAIVQWRAARRSPWRA